MRCKWLICLEFSLGTATRAAGMVDAPWSMACKLKANADSGTPESGYKPTH